MISRIIERVGDHAVRIAENAVPIIDVDLDKKILGSIKKASAMSLEIFDREIVSFFNTDMKEAHRNIESIQALENISAGYQQLVLKQDTMIAIHVGYIAESIRRAGEYAGDISETVINLLVEEDRPAKKTKPGK